MPFVGILTRTGSFSSIIPPFFDQTSSAYAISWKLPQLPHGYGIEDLGPLPFYRVLQGYTAGCEIFPYHDKNELIFLFSDAKNKAVKFNIDKSIHRKISNSITPNVWAHYPVGIRINNFFWIFGGVKDYNAAYMNIASGAVRQGILMTRYVLDGKLLLTLVHLGVFTKNTPLPKIACHFKSDVPRAMKTLDFSFGIFYHLLIEIFF